MSFKYIFFGRSMNTLFWCMKYILTKKVFLKISVWSKNSQTKSTEQQLFANNRATASMVNGQIVICSSVGRWHERCTCRDSDGRKCVAMAQRHKNVTHWRWRGAKHVRHAQLCLRVFIQYIMLRERLDKITFVAGKAGLYTLYSLFTVGKSCSPAENTQFYFAVECITVI